jgi:hypothetical protein
VADVAYLALALVSFVVLLVAFRALASQQDSRPTRFGAFGQEGVVNHTEGEALAGSFDGARSR